MKDITINTNSTIRNAMKVLDKTSEKCLIVVDKNKKLLGTLTDGDLRRSILAGIKVSEDISDCYEPKPTFLVQNKFTIEESKNLLKDKKLDLIPIVDSNQIVKDYVTWFSVGESNPENNLKLNRPVVIMAGGKGTRMAPFTKVLPKPLIPIDEKTIIEHIIECFTKIGCNQFHITVNYKSSILKAYFEDLQPDYKVQFIDEKIPLGTAGSLHLLNGKFSEPFFVTNCDIIVKANYVSIYDFHKKGGYDVTLVASAKEYVIPYGTCDLNDEGYLSHINEKPKYNFLINTGLYILNPDILDLIPENKFYHITHLIEEAKNKGKKIGVFPIDDEAWIDVGQWAEYKKVVKEL